MVLGVKFSARQTEALYKSSQKYIDSNKEVSAKWAMRTRQSLQGGLRIIKHTTASTKQTDKQAIMAAEEATIAEGEVQVATEAAKMAVQASCGQQRQQSKSTEWGTQTWWTHHVATDIQLEFHRQICRTEELQNGGEEYVPKLQYKQSRESTHYKKID